MVNDRWTGIKFPDFAADPGKGIDPDTARGDETANWVDAPATSHVHSFAILGGTGRTRSTVVTGNTTILVRFKDPKTGGPKSKYRYVFRDRPAAEAVFSQLRIAEHPGAHPLIQSPGKGVPGLVSYSRS